MNIAGSQEARTLQLGFLADRMVEVLDHASKAEDPEGDLSELDDAIDLLRSLSEGATLTGRGGAPTLNMRGIRFFGHAAEALKAVKRPLVDISPQEAFEQLANYLELMRGGGKLEKEALESLSRFFEGLSTSTVEAWGRFKPPTTFAPIQ